MAVYGAIINRSIRYTLLKSVERVIDSDDISKMVIIIMWSDCSDNYDI